MNRSILLLILLLTASPISVHAQSDQPDLYDIGGEFAFVRIQYDSYYSSDFYGPLGDRLPRCR